VFGGPLVGVGADVFDEGHAGCPHPYRTRRFMLRNLSGVGIVRQSRHAGTGERMERATCPDDAQLQSPPATTSNNRPHPTSTIDVGPRLVPPPAPPAEQGLVET
jgi:hypothetical protein